MKDVTFNVQYGCGKSGRTIYRINDMCKIGGYLYNKEGAVKSLDGEYEGNDKDAYLSKIEELYSGSCSIDAIYTIGRNILLQMAIAQSDLDMVKYIVSLGVDVHLQNDVAFQLACETGDLSVVKYMMTLGVDVRTTNGLPMRLAIKEDHVEVIEYLAHVHNIDNRQIERECSICLNYLWGY